MDSTAVVEEEEDAVGGCASTSSDSKHGSSPRERHLEFASSKSSADNLRAAQIDRSKYLINQASTRLFDSHNAERSSGRKFSQAFRKEVACQQGRVADGDVVFKALQGKSSHQAELVRAQDGRRQKFSGGGLQFGTSSGARVLNQRTCPTATQQVNNGHRKMSVPCKPPDVQRSVSSEGRDDMVGCDDGNNGDCLSSSLSWVGMCKVCFSWNNFGAFPERHNAINQGCADLLTDQSSDFCDNDCII